MTIAYHALDVGNGHNGIGILSSPNGSGSPTTALDLRQVAGHCDIAPGRKTDPGPAFDWLRLYDSMRSV